MTEERFNVFEYGYGREYSITHIDAIFKSKRDAERVSDMLNEQNEQIQELEKENEQLKQRINELELLNDGLEYALKYIKKIDVEIDVGE